MDGTIDMSQSTACSWSAQLASSSSVYTLVQLCNTCVFFYS